MTPLRTATRQKVAALLLAFFGLALSLLAYALFSDDGGRFAGSHWGVFVSIPAWVALAASVVLALAAYRPRRR